VYFLDVDTLARVFREDALITRRLDRTDPNLIRVSSITAEEMLGGSLSQINRVRDQSKSGNMETPSRLFVRLIAWVSAFRILPYTNAAEEVYRAYDASVKRAGKMDCRLAAHASAEGFTVVTCNTADFLRIPASAWRIGAGSRSPCCPPVP